MSVSGQAEPRAIIQSIMRVLASNRGLVIQPQTIAQEIADGTGKPAENLLGICEASLVFLELFGVLKRVASGVVMEGQVRSYFVNSLIWYLETDSALLSNWDRSSASRDGAAEDILDNASYFVRLMEEKRRKSAAVNLGSIKGSRTQKVSAVLIKTGVGSSARYLHQWDSKSRQFQLIGGKIREKETPIEAASREVSEELHEKNMMHFRDFELELVTSSPILYQDISRTYGALTDYECYFFLAKMKVARIQLSHDDRWLTKRKMDRGRTDSGRQIRSPAVTRSLDASLSGGLEGLPSSISRQPGNLGWLADIEVKPGMFGVRVDLKALIAKLFRRD
jgi:hypothetical protein